MATPTEAAFYEMYVSEGCDGDKTITVQVAPETSTAPAWLVLTTVDDRKKEISIKYGHKAVGSFVDSLLRISLREAIGLRNVLDAAIEAAAR